MLATTGLRRGELMRLVVGDYDPLQRTLAIRESEFHKSGLVPLSANTGREIEHLIETRDRRRLPAGAESPLLWHRCPSRGGYSGGSFSQALRALFQRVGIRTWSSTPTTAGSGAPAWCCPRSWARYPSSHRGAGATCSGLSAPFGSTRNVVGANDETTFGAELFFDTYVTYQRDRDLFSGVFQLESGFQKAGRRRRPRHPVGRLTTGSGWTCCTPGSSMRGSGPTPASGCGPASSSRTCS